MFHPTQMWHALAEMGGTGFATKAICRRGVLGRRYRMYVSIGWRLYRRPQPLFGQKHHRSRSGCAHAVDFLGYGVEPDHLALVGNHTRAA